ncbi:M23 family metallopeptidase [Arthrobacter ulcerisalmonis]
MSQSAVGAPDARAIGAIAVVDSSTTGSQLPDTTFGAQSGTGAAASGTVAAGVLAPIIVSDPTVVLPFSRSAIGGAGLASAMPAGVGPGAIGGILSAVNGARAVTGTLMAPLATLSPSSPYGYRVSPITGSSADFHLGQDFSAPCGTTVYAADRGVVRAAGWHPGRRQPGGDRPWRRADHHLQPPAIHRRSHWRRRPDGAADRPGGHHRLVHGLPPAL